MRSLLAIPFICLVIWDMVLTYKVIASGKGRETAFAKCYIKNKGLTLFLTMLGILLILLLTAETPEILLLPIGAFGYACWKNYGVLHGR